MDLNKQETFSEDDFLQIEIAMQIEVNCFFILKQKNVLMKVRKVYFFKKRPISYQKICIETQSIEMLN